jgi:hypothetical protein
MNIQLKKSMVFICALTFGSTVFASGASVSIKLCNHAPPATAANPTSGTDNKACNGTNCKLAVTGGTVSTQPNTSGFNKALATLAANATTSSDGCATVSIPVQDANTTLSIPANYFAVKNVGFQAPSGFTFNPKLAYCGSKVDFNFTSASPSAEIYMFAGQDLQGTNYTNYCSYVKI